VTDIPDTSSRQMTTYVTA